MPSPWHETCVTPESVRPGLVAVPYVRGAQHRKELQLLRGKLAELGLLSHLSDYHDPTPGADDPWAGLRLALNRLAARDATYLAVPSFSTICVAPVEMALTMQRIGCQVLPLDLPQSRVKINVPFLRRLSI